MLINANAWLSGSRTCLCATLDMLALGQGWRKDMYELEGKRIARDEQMARQMEQAARAIDWQAFSSGAQSASRDYLSASADIWQDCIRIATGNQGSLAVAVERASGEWRGFFSEVCRGVPGFDAAATPAHAWIAAFERLLGSSLPAAPGAPPVRTREVRSARAEQHVG
jgi:hypothetical protein